MPAPITEEENSLVDAPPAVPSLSASSGTVPNRQRLPQHRGGGASEQSAEALRYWVQRLAGAPPALDLPVEPGGKRSHGQTQLQIRPHPVALSRSAVDALDALGAQESCAPHIVLLCSLQTLLLRYTGQTDILIRVGVSGQGEGTPPDCGGDDLVVRADLTGDPSFRELIRRIRDTVQEGLAHKLSFEALRHHLADRQEELVQSVSQIGFLWHDASAARRSGRSEWNNRTADTFEPAPELRLNLGRTGGDIAGSIEYRVDLFSEETISRVSAHLKTLIEGAAAAPDMRLSELPMLDAAECRQLLVEWNDTASGYEHSETLVSLFESQVARTPCARALVCEGVTLTYEELNGRAGALAAHLRTLGVGPETLVGICVERSWQMIAGILGVLKAGAAYVPLDPAYPPERIGFILKDASMPVVLTQQSLVPRVSDSLRANEPHSSSAPNLLCLDCDWKQFGQKDGSTNTPGVQAHHLAYVIYTSGSTGTPKGVAIEHRSVTALVHWARGVFNEQDLAGVLASSSICFDLSVFELFVPLTTGGGMILAENALQLPALAAAASVTLVNTVPSAMKELLRVKGVPASVRVINLAGEPLPTALVDRLYEETAVERVYDLYGPTETTVYSTYTLRRAGEPPTIGRPLVNERVYLLDTNRQPVPAGVAGELYIGGDGLARGYFKRPELTAERFVQHAFSPCEPAQRLFRTGDLGRFRADGNIEFLGRIDHQVKIRGFRIELGEIETVLRQHSAIRECIVVARDDRAGDRRLVAYYVTAPGAALATEELRRFLQAKVAAYMIPSIFVPLTALPLTPNGKVDRRALPEPDPALMNHATEFVSPRNETERQLAALWEKALDVSPVGVRHNFFEVGGDSLMAARLVTQIAETFGRNLSIGAFFEAPTVEQLATLLLERDRNPHERPPASIVEIQPAGTKAPLYLVHGMGGGMFWGYANLSRYLGPDQPVFAFSSRGLDGREEFETIEEMAAHYVAELRAFQPEGPYQLGGYCFGGNVAYEMARLLAAQGQRVALLALFNCPARHPSYQRFRFTPRFCLEFLRNVRRRAAHVLGLDRERRWHFFRWKTRSLARKSGRLLNRLRGAGENFDAEEWEDLSRLPEDRQQLWATHIRAYRAHQPQPYNGPITLFRTHDHELLCSFDEAYGWRELAPSVTVCMLPGAHQSIFEEPHVQAVAAAVREHLSTTASPAKV